MKDDEEGGSWWVAVKEVARGTFWIALLTGVLELAAWGGAR